MENWWFHGNYQGIEFDVAGPPCEKPIAWKQSKIHGTNLKANDNTKNFLCPHMIYPMGVPGSDGNPVSESPRKILR